MESIFAKDPARRPPPSNIEKIEKEIAHLKNSPSVRDKPGQKAKRFASWVFILVMGSILGLFFMDPFIYAMRKSEAVSVYLYLSNTEAKSATDALLASKIFSTDEIETLNRRQGAYQDYFSSPKEAEDEAAAIVAYVQSLHDLHNDNYGALDRLGRVRCKFFIHNGLIPPMSWSALNPSIAD